MPELEVQGNDESSDEEEKKEEEEQGSRQSAGIAGDILKPSRYVMVMRITKSMFNSIE